MPIVVRCDDEELVCRKRGGFREWGIALCALSAWLLISPLLRLSPDLPYSRSVPVHVPVEPMFLLFFIAGLCMIFPAEFRIRFAERRYQLVTELDWLTFHPAGHEGSCDEIDHVEVEYQPERGGRSTWGWVSLVWKDPSCPSYLLTEASLNILDDAGAGARFQPHRYGVAERIASRLGVPLEVIGVESPPAGGQPSVGQAKGDQS